MLEGEVGREEGDDGFRAAPSEGVVGQVERLERGRVGERVAQRRQSLRDLRDESTGEDVGEVGDLSVGSGVRTRLTGGSVCGGKEKVRGRKE